MKKSVKMVLYGEPGTGKSTFASKFPKPFFICTDGNYGWLDKPEEDHVQVSSWEEAKEIINKKDFSNYETIVVDLTEDLFKWCEYSFCERNKLIHVSDLGYGKGYDISRNEFFIEMCKLISLEKNIIFIMHGQDVIVKDRRGVEHTKHTFSSRLPDKVADMIEGRVQFFIRCYMKAEEVEENVLVKKRYLSLIPKENEFGIARGVDELKVPQDIPLDYDCFAEVIGINSKVSEEQSKMVKTTKVEVKMETPVATNSVNEIEPKVVVHYMDPVETVTPVTPDPVVEDHPPFEINERVERPNVTISERDDIKTETPREKISKEDQMAAIKAKLAAMKLNK